MTIGFAKKLASTVAVNPDCDLIGHRSAGHIESRFHTKQFGRPLFQPINRRIDINHGVSDERVSHRLAHFWCGLSDGIAA